MNQSLSRDEYKVRDVGGGVLEAEELEICIDRFGTDVYKFCWSLCQNKLDAEDLYQQTFLKALEKDWKLNWEENPKALFFSLAWSLWKSSLRKKARRSSIAPCDALDDKNQQIADTDKNTEDSILKESIHEEIRRIITALPDNFRLPIVLYYHFDFSIEKIAQIAGKPAGTIKSRLYTGRKLIKKRLEEMGYDKLH